MRTCAVALFVSVALPLAARAATGASTAAQPSAGCQRKDLQRGRELHRRIEVDGMKREYILDVPDRVVSKHPVPLLFDFHGFGHSAQGVSRVSGFRSVAARDGFITVYPDGAPVTLLGRSDRGWEILAAAPNRDLDFTRRMLNDIEQTYCIDRTRVFATGFSNGAFFSYLLACTMADRFAAIAPVSGATPPAPCPSPRAIPVMIHHGRNDERVDVQLARMARDEWVQRNACEEHGRGVCEWYHHCRDGADVEYCEDDGEHYWPTAATERIWKFFQDHPMAHVPRSR